MHAVEVKHRGEERRSELDFIKNGLHPSAFDKDEAVEEFKRKWGDES